MRPSHCPACHGDRFATVDLRADFWIAPFRMARARHVACLECGVVTAYLDDATLAKLRSRQPRPVKPQAADADL